MNKFSSFAFLDCTSTQLPSYVHEMRYFFLLCTVRYDTLICRFICQKNDIYSIFGSHTFSPFLPLIFFNLTQNTTYITSTFDSFCC